jgi:hypothetical protein
MIHGRFGEVHRPYLSANVMMTEARRTAKVNFLLDCGADATCIMPADAFALRIDISNAVGVEQRGIGGTETVYFSGATLSFLDLGVGLVVYDTIVHVFPNRPPYDDYPSLLGRNVIDRWRLRYSFPEKILTAEALQHDLLIPLLISPDRPG